MLLEIDYMKREQAYIITPLHSHDNYVFLSYIEAKEFIDMWFQNPAAAMFAYHLTVEAM